MHACRSTLEDPTAPRAAAALLVVPAVVSLAARRPVAALVSLVICALLHVWLGALCAALLGVAVAAEWVVTRYDLLRRPYPYVLLGLGLFGGRELVTTVIVAATVLFWCRAPDESLERRGLVLTAILLVVCAAAVAVFASEPVVRTLEAAVGFPVVREIPARLSGVRYSLVTLGAVLAGRRLAATWSRTRALVFPATLVLLVVVPLLHPEPYQRVAARQSGFFGKNCPEAHAIPLPAGVMSLSLADEPTLFLSLAEYVAGD